MNEMITGSARGALIALLATIALAACSRQPPAGALPPTAAASLTPAAAPSLTAAPTLTPAIPAPTSTDAPAATQSPAPPPQAATPVPTVQPRRSADGSQIAIQLPAGQTLGDVAVTADGRSVLYTLDAGYAGLTPLYIVPIGGGVPRVLATGLGDGAGGRSITEDVRQHFGQPVPPFLLSASGEEVVYRTPDALYLLPLDGGGPTRLSAPVPADSGIYGYNFRSDGRWLVYDVQRFDPWDLPQTPTWGSGTFKIRALYSVALPGGPATLLATAPSDDGAIAGGYAFEPQADTLVFVTDSSDGEPDPPERRYWRVPLAGGEATPLPALPPQ